MAIALERFAKESSPGVGPDLSQATGGKEHGNSQIAANARRFESVEIAVGDAVADTVDDLRHATAEELEYLSLTLRNDRLRVDLWLRNADIAVESTDAEARAMAEDIADFIRKRRSWRGSFRALPKRAMLAGVLPMGIGIGSVVDELRKPDPNFALAYVYLGLTAAFPLLIFGLAVFVVRAYGSIYTVPEWRANVRGISKRGQRDLVIVLLGAVIGGIIAGVLGFWNGLLVK